MRYLLEQAGYRVALLGTIENSIGTRSTRSYDNAATRLSPIIFLINVYNKLLIMW